MKKILLLYIGTFLLTYLFVKWSQYIGPPGSYVISPAEYVTQVLDTTTHIVYNINAIASVQSGGFTSNGGANSINCNAHGGGLIDMTGQVWVSGDNANGELGQGNTSSLSGYQEVTQDSTGAAWPGTGKTVVQLIPMGTTTGWSWGALLSDSTIWAWGSLTGGMRGAQGNTYSGSSITTRPVQVYFPGGTKIVQIGSSNCMYARDVAGNMWSWGGYASDNIWQAYLGQNTASPIYNTPTQMVLPLACTYFICAGKGVFMYLSNNTTYGCGPYLGLLGIGSPASSVGNLQYYYETPYGGTYIPVKLDTAWNLAHPIMIDPINGKPKIYANSSGVYVIETDSSLWSVAMDGANGCLGNGIEAYYNPSTTKPQWDQGIGDIYNGNANTSANFQQRKPVQIGPGIKWYSVFGNTALDYYTWAVDVNGNLWSWGRGKAGCLGDQFLACDYVAGGYNSSLPNWADRPWPTMVPLSNLFGSTTYTGYAAYCVFNPSTSPCNDAGCTIPSSSTISARAVSTPITNGVTLDCSTSTNTGSLPWWNRIWKLYNVNTGLPVVLPYVTFTSTTITLAPGNYAAMVQMEDQRRDTSSSTFTIFTVSAGLPPNTLHKIKRFKIP